jgi:hypothetical protein
MAISALRGVARGPLDFDPLQDFCVEYSQIAMVFLSIIPSKHIQLLIVQCGCMVLDLRSLVEE